MVEREVIRWFLTGLTTGVALGYVVMAWATQAAFHSQVEEEVERIRRELESEIKKG